MGEAPPRAIASLKVKSSSRGNGLENGAGFLGVLVCVDGGSVGYEACPIFSDARKLATAPLTPDASPFSDIPGDIHSMQ
ncbi:hypothetical protein [Nostoc sp.]